MKAKPYIRWRNGTKTVDEYSDQSLAYSVYLGLPKGVRAAFRGAGDARPVYAWDYVDRM